MDVERGPDTDQDSSVDPVSVGSHPQFLLGSSEPHPHEVRLGGADELHDVLLFLRRQVAEGRGVGASDPQARERAA
jgi:hypothetical protein